MTSKLTLNVKSDVVTRSKKFAAQSGRSLSKLVEHYLDSLTKHQEDDEELSPRLKRLKGSIKLPKNFDEKKEWRKHLEKKYS